MFNSLQEYYEYLSGITSKTQDATNTQSWEQSASGSYTNQAQQLLASPPTGSGTKGVYEIHIPLTYTPTENNMWYIPTGPAQLSQLGAFLIAGNKWTKYKIDLIDSSGYTYNLNPMFYFRKNKCGKYNPYQLFWLNPHGGFDSHIFYMKNRINFNIERILWEHRYSDTYQLGERGTTVYKTIVEQEITLQSDWLTQSESQILNQLTMSPEVYMLYIFNGNPFKIPLVVNDTQTEYADKKLDKMVNMTIKVSPAYKRISQTT